MGAEFPVEYSMILPRMVATVDLSDFDLSLTDAEIAEGICELVLEHAKANVMVTPSSLNAVIAQIRAALEAERAADAEALAS